MCRGGTFSSSRPTEYRQSVREIARLCEIGFTWHAHKSGLRSGGVSFIAVLMREICMS